MLFFVTYVINCFIYFASESEFKSSCSSGMLSAVEKYAPGPGKKCAIDTLFEVLRAAGMKIDRNKVE